MNDSKPPLHLTANQVTMLALLVVSGLIVVCAQGRHFAYPSSLISISSQSNGTLSNSTVQRATETSRDSRMKRQVAASVQDHPVVTAFYDSGLTNAVHGTMTVDSQGRLLVTRITCNTLFCGVQVQSLSPQGTQNWISASLGDPYAALNNGRILIGQGDTAYYLGNGIIFAFMPSGSFVQGWPVAPPSRFTSLQPVLLDQLSGVVYARTGSASIQVPLSLDAINPDGSSKWHKEYTVGESGGAALFFGAAGNLYTYIYPEGLAQIDRNTGVELCRSTTLAARFLTGSIGTPEGVFTAGSQIRVLGSDCVTTTIYTADSGKSVGLYDATGGRLFGFEYPTSAYDQDAVEPACFSAAGALLWRNQRILQRAPIGSVFSIGVQSALKNGVLYVFGRDTADGNKRKLFLVSTSSGEVLSAVETAGLCGSCGVAVADDGTIYLADLGSTKIYRITGLSGGQSFATAWWKGENNAADSLGENHGTTRNGVSFQTGKIGSGFSFDGVDDYVNIPDSATLDSITTGISVEAWINPERPSAPALGGEDVGRAGIFSRRNPNVNECFTVSVRSDGKLRIDLRTSVSGSTFVSTNSIIQFDGRWKHMAVTGDTTTGLVRAYINGQVIPLTTLVGPTVISGEFVNADNLYIGHRQPIETLPFEGVAGAGPFKGLIDEVVLYGRALPSWEVLEISRSAKGPMLSSIAPATPAVGASSVRVYGENLVPGLTATLTTPTGLPIAVSAEQIQNVTGSSFLMNVPLNIQGTYRLTATNPDGANSPQIKFTTQAVGPIVQNISPNVVSTDDWITVTGTGFHSNSSLSLTVLSQSGGSEGTSEVSEGDVERLNSTEIRVRVRLCGTGQRTVEIQVENPDKKAAAGTFTVNRAACQMLRGTIGIRSETNELWKLNGSGVGIEVSLLQNGIRVPDVSGTVGGGTYSIAVPGTGDYTIEVVLKYREKIISNRKFCLESLDPVGAVAPSDEYRTTTLRVDASLPRSADLNLNFPPPLVLVHGINSSHQKWTGWAAKARDNGFIVFTPNYRFACALSPGNFWLDNATEVFDQIRSDFVYLNRKAEHNDYAPWLYVAHSMGGLVGRALAAAATSESETKLIQSLKMMYQLGTPNSGGYKSLGLKINSGSYISEAYIRRDFNPRFQDFGDYLPLHRVGMFLGWIEGSSDEDRADGYVREYSALNIIINEHVAFWSDPRTVLHTLALLKRYAVEHTLLGSSENLEPLTGPGFILNKACDLTKKDTNSVSNESVANETTVFCKSFPTSSVQALGVSTSDSSVPPITQIYSQIDRTDAAIDSGQTVSLVFPVGLTDNLQVSAASLSGSASFQLLNPQGALVEPVSIPPTVGTYSSDSEGLTIRLYNPSPGSWTIRGTAASPGTQLALLAEERSLLRFDARPERAIARQGETAQLLAFLTGDNVSLSGISVSAKVVGESGDIVSEVMLFDDGLHGDAASGDRIYGGLTGPLSSTGRHRIRFQARGMYRGYPFSRIQDDFIDVLSAAPFFTGESSDYAVDADLDGAYERIRLSVEVVLPSTGSFVATADLHDSEGYFVSHAVGYIEANTPGSNLISLDFPMANAFCSQFGGRFTVSALSLHNSELVALDSYEQYLATHYYDGANFTCKNGAPSPRIVAVEPTSLRPGDSAQIMISGQDFAPGAQMQIGDGVSISSLTRLLPNLLIAQVSVSGVANLGPRSVVVTNPDNRSFVATGLFEIVGDASPTVAFNNVTDQQRINGTITLSATAIDDKGVASVEFYVDGSIVGLDHDFPYQVTWDSSVVTSGTHLLRVKAIDTGGQAGEMQISIRTGACQVLISPISALFGSSGGSGSIVVTGDSDCPWAAVSNDGWMTLTSAASGTGNGTVGYSVTPNTTGIERTGTITVADKTLMVTQRSQVDYEADVAPRPNGSGTVVVSDWVQVGRFSVGLDTVSQLSEVQRADCAPRATLGDGRITVADWVQAGRYSVGLDPPTEAGGPSVISRIKRQDHEDKMREIYAARNASFTRDRHSISVPVELTAYGGENGITFSIHFDATVLSYVGFEPGRDAAQNAIFLVNSARVALGSVGFGIALKTGVEYGAGIREVVRIRFDIRNPAAGSTVIGVGDGPTDLGLADVDAGSLSIRSVRSTVSLVDSTIVLNATLGNHTVATAKHAAINTHASDTTIPLLADNDSFVPQGPHSGIVSSRCLASNKVEEAPELSYHRVLAITSRRRRSIQCETFSKRSSRGWYR